MNNITTEERIKIEALYDQGRKVPEIANYLNRHKSSIYRELSKCDAQGRYTASYATKLTKENFSTGRYQGPDKITISLIESKLLSEQWSPEQISGWLRKTHDIIVSHVWIYKHIEADRQDGGELHNHMRHGRYQKGHKPYCGPIKGRQSIELRPIVVQERKRYGDLEIDLVVGPKNKGALLSIIDRKSRYCSLRLLSSKQKEVVATAVITAIDKSYHDVLTITSDNGTEFADHKHISKNLKVNYYFAHPYASYERGSIENLNGLIRQYLPKGMSFERLTQEDIDAIERKLNNRPRKILDYATPYEIECKNRIERKNLKSRSQI